MKIELNVAAVIALMVGIVPVIQAQPSAVNTRRTATHQNEPPRKSTRPSLAAEVHQMREELQAQIDDLRTRLAAKDAEVAALQQRTAAAGEIASAQSQAAATQVQTLNARVQQNAIAVTSVQSSVSELGLQAAAVSSGVQQVQKATEKIQKSMDEPAAIHYKGVTISPGGFIAGESIWRQRAMNADIYNNFNATPYMNSGEAHTSEWVPTARGSRPSVLVSGKTPFGTLSGFLEVDFLGVGAASNNLQSNSYTPRIRQGWVQAQFGRTKITAGQMWTLLSENKKSTDPGQEAVPLIFDQNLHVGDTYLRQTGIRIQEAITPKVTLAMSLENSQYQFSASNAPANFFFGAPGALGGLENSLANYTNQVAPDVIVKLAFDPGFGHYEFGGVGRFFRDRYYPNTSAAGAQNDTRFGGGLVANARFPITRKADLGLHFVGGDGTGRYGASLLPDVTVRPNGTLAPIRNAQALFSLDLHPTKKLDLFGYAGTEYAQRTVHANGSGVLVGYAPITGSNAGCNTEGVPTAGTGLAPGASACLGATRVIVEGSAGWVYRIYTGPAGRLQYGAAYSYLTREGWNGVGGAPKATNNLVYTSLRYYIP